MSSNKGEVHCNSGDIPSTDKLVDDVVESCKNLGFHHDDEGRDSPDESEVLDDDFVDEVYLKDLDVSSSQEELERRKESAIKEKGLGNDLFKNGEYEEARKKYTEALRMCPLVYEEERAMLYSNRAAAKLKGDMKKEAIEDCSKAIELNPKYVKAFLRRAKLYEETEKLNEALEDYKKILELDPGNSEAKVATMRLPAEINSQNEKLKAEMLGSLKELGNKLLKPFGLSTENFQVQQDPNSGGYSINFTQNKK